MELKSPSRVRNREERVARMNEREKHPIDEESKLKNELVARPEVETILSGTFSILTS